MNKSILLASSALGVFALFASCADDNDSNPVLVQPTVFVLNSPAYANEYVDLGNSKAVNLTWSQPKYSDDNAPMNITYEIQVGNKGSKFEKAYSSESDNNAEADYIVLDETFTTCASGLDPKGIAKGLELLNQWDEEEKVPEMWDASLRVRAYASEVNGTQHCPVVSNAIDMKFNPCFVNLEVDPEIWFLVGSCVGNGSWGGDVPKALYPMFTVDNFKYNGKGRGEITWTGWLTTSGFKLKLSTTSWDAQWGQGSAGYVKNDGGSGNITVAKDGYYTITLNTASDELKIEEYAAVPAEYESCSVSGSFNGWTDLKMSPVHTYAGAHNHDWYAEVELGSQDQFKFKITDSWDVNWGLPQGSAEGTAVAWAYGSAGGPNIGVAEKGTYLLLLNDITGFYRVLPLGDNGLDVNEDTGILNFNYLSK